MGEASVLGDLLVRGKPDAGALVKEMQHRVEEVSFGEGIGLLGYDLSTETLRPGETVLLTLYWECRRPLVNSYMVFTHLLDDASVVQGQRDAIPGQGSAPTSGWAAGDVVVDRYEIPLRAAATAGPVRLEIGLYDPFSGERLPLWRDGRQTGEDHLILPTTITVPR